MWVNDAQPPPPHDLAGVTGEGHGPYLPQVPSCTQRHPPTTTRGAGQSSLSLWTDPGQREGSDR